MSTKRLSQLLIATLLVVAAVFASRPLYNPGSANSSKSAYVGIGDLHRYEAAQVARRPASPPAASHMLAWATCTATK